MASFRLRKIGGTLWLGLLLLAGVTCSAEVTPLDTAAPRPSSTPPAEATVLSTAVPTRTPVSPAMERLPIPTLTATPEPVLDPAALLHSNGDCRLPCWWGIVPGQTDWASAEALLAPSSVRIAPYERTGYTYYTAYLIDPEQPSEQPINVDLAVWDDTVQLVRALGKTGSRLTPSVVLKTYGIPDEVWLRTFSERREGVLDFEVVLVYLEQGFLILYGTPRAILNGEDVVGCIHNLYQTLVLVAWNPKLRLNFAEAMKIGMSGRVTTEYLGLEAATGKTLQSFYNDFSTGGSEVCLRTPRQLWPDP